MPPMEVKLWKRLRMLRAEGFHFRRQAPFRGYYLDFVCFSRRLVVELDGGQHSDNAQLAHDAVRDAVIRREGFTVLRFWNGAVRDNIDGVMHSIRLALGADGFAVCPSP
ncbi:MAG: endonuclease domain-containing protein [Pseudomonadota bacterium]